MRISSPKILSHAKGQRCQIRIPDICNGNPETTVACHLPSETKGMGIKSDDIYVAYGCSDCHMVCDLQDGRWKKYSSVELDYFMFTGMMRTWKLLIEQGLIKIPVPVKRLPVPTFPIEKKPKKQSKWAKRPIQSRGFGK